jgi:phospholipid/cholesterol/gamma-HCH transport system permease protein
MRSRIDTVIGAVGRRAIAVALYPVDLTAFVIQAVRDWRYHGRLLNRAAFSSLVAQIIFTGIDALPMITLIGVAVGLGLVSQLISVMHVFGSTHDMVNVLSQVVVLELGPLLTAILIIGRSASAIAVDLGNMKLNKEVEGLWMLGVNTNDFLVTPRLLGTAISQLALAVYFTLIAMVSGTLFVTLLVAPGYLRLLEEIPRALDPFDLVLFLVKNFIFGLVAAAAACHHGLQVERSRTELPQQTQRAIVNAISLVFILDGLFALSRL